MSKDIELKKFLQFLTAGIIVLLLFSIINAYNGFFIHALVELGFCVGTGVVALFFYYKKIEYISALQYFIAILSIFYLYLLLHGGIANTGLIWSLSFPVFAFMLSNKKTGVLFSLAHLMLILGVYGLSKWDFLFIHYDFVQLRQVLSVYILISILSYISQAKVEESSKLLKKFNDELQDKIGIAIENNRKQELHLFQQAKNAQIGEMIGMIAHQWRQPLNALGLIIQKILLMSKKGSLSQKKIEDSVTKSMSLIENMSTTINDFMNYLRVDKEKHTFSLYRVVSEIVSVLSMQFEKKEVSFEFDFDQNILICSYQSELSHVLSNLISNAIDAFDGKSIENKRIFISAFVDEEENLLECSVKDNAGGIANAIIDNIFNAYFTTKEQGKGTGIGLNMSKRIVETLLSGTITADNDTDGAIFTIRLPLK